MKGCQLVHFNHVQMQGSESKPNVHYTIWICFLFSDNSSAAISLAISEMQTLKLFSFLDNQEEPDKLQSTCGTNKLQSA